MTSRYAAPPRRLAIAVACIASAMLLLEIIVTRLFSVLFYYHFSFFAVSLVMSGLVIGGILAARTDAHAGSDDTFARGLVAHSARFSISIVAALVAICALSRLVTGNEPSMVMVALSGLIFLPGLVAAGAFLAIAFARDRRWIGTLYAWDLVAAAIACVAAILLLRLLQGPVVLLAPAALAAVGALVLADGRRQRILGAALVASVLGLMGAGVTVGSHLLRFTSDTDTVPLLERWNEHSRITAMDLGTAGRYLVIDRSASTPMRAIPPTADGSPVPADPSWAEGVQYPVYAVGRPAASVAIIGVGGGGDLLPPLWHGAKRVDGYELNSTFIELLEEDFRDFNAIATRPEVSLIHSEARVGIARSGRTYDVIQASLIDTWAATASGGFVLSENGLYTREGWATFLSHLTDTGILTMTRWHLDDAPAETHRLVSLASASLTDAGIVDPRSCIVLLRSTRYATILVSRTPFSPDEISRLRDWCATADSSILVGPGIPSADPVIERLLDPSTRQAAIDASVFNISPPDDARPYFFLQVRPSDLLNLGRTDFGGIREITFNGVRVMMILGACAVLLVIGVMLLTVFGVPGSNADASSRRRYRLMTVYFAGIGLGYILIQLGLHQRLIIILGHPTLALSVVLFSMLLGTGVGAALSERLLPDDDVRRAGLLVLGTLGALWLSFPMLQAIGDVGSTVLRISSIAAMLMVVGGVLGLAFPLGVRLVSPTGEWAVQKMWAINGAASIAASVMASLVGITAGARTVILCGVVAYAAAFLAGVLARRSAILPEPESRPHASELPSHAGSLNA